MTEIQNPTEEPVVEPTAEPATEPVAAEETAAVAEPAAEEVAEPATESVAEPAAEEAAEPVVEDAVEEPQAETSTTSIATFETEAEVVNRLKEISESDEEVTRQELDSLKSNFYRIHRQQADAAYKKFIEEGGAAEEYAPEPDPEETTFKELMAVIREKRAAVAAALEQEREENYQKKLEIIDKIKALTENPDEINRGYNDFKELQQQWNDIKEVPADKATNLWKTYQQAVEAFYDTLKLSNELRAYDFKKNLERKTALCEAAEALAEETDIIVAFRKLQQLHQDFRETGPVASDLREQIWTRFKDASTVINKRHQEFFEARKQKEEENLTKKTAICETIEGFDLEGLKTFAEWNAISEKITTLQAEWKTIGYAPQKMNTKIFERFRAACDNFFTRKNEYFQTVRENLNQNYALKLELVEKAEALKDSTDWKATTDALVELQKKWKEIGTVPKKYSDQIWERFNAACDAFFAAKKEANKDVHTEQTANMEKKKAIIDALAAIVPEEFEGDLRTKLREAQEEWNQIGHVPFKEKDKLYKLLREQMDRLYGFANEHAAKRRIDRFKESIKGGNGGDVRSRLTRQLDILNNEIKTYENNLGFLTLSSKSKQGNALIEELNRKMEKLKADKEEVKAKLKALDEQ
ncbi:MAG: DUF349 domain-containing protein [Bacteroidaceae bacterium]|nr:DUF349 domain-containing protein [Bacteroidaceae bacterium]MDD7527616.1 DUF349 domain-containing protein [Prevotellaceae bacterium]MDY5760120.1 DUF349 domain-containing protein [Bacteroidaceae bacterium]